MNLGGAVPEYKNPIDKERAYGCRTLIMPLESLSNTYLLKLDERTKHSVGVRLLMGALLVKETDKAPQSC